MAELPRTAVLVGTYGYLPWLRVAARSFVDANKSGRALVVLVDPPESLDMSADHGVQFIAARDTNVDPAEFVQLATIYDAFELCCALKPVALDFCRTTIGGPVVYLDSDVRVYDSIDPLIEVTHGSAAGVALCPHLLSPPRHALSFTDRDYLRVGPFNGGVIATDDRSKAFLDWWATRLRWDCLNDQFNGLFVDQAWLAAAAGMFQIGQCRDPGVNLAYWNLPERKVSRVANRWYVDDYPLRIAHFSGFDPLNPAVITKHHPEQSRAFLADNPRLSPLFDEYASELIEAGYEDHAAASYGFARGADGVLIDPTLRRAVRATSLALIERGDDPTPPDPFLEGADALVRFVRTVPEHRPRRAHQIIASSAGVLRELRHRRTFRPNLRPR
jgi:hypothetical protein